MYKSISILAIVCFVALVEAGENHEQAEVVQGMTRAFNEGMARFGGAVTKKMDNVVPMPGVESSKVFSLYTQGLKAPGGGKPSVLDQYRKHSYYPLAPVVVPKEHKPIRGKMTAADAAARLVPEGPFQYTGEITHI